MPENIFISYARADGESHAQKLNTDLKALGHETWFDKDQDSGIHPGLAWQKEIQQGIDDCTVFVLVMTPASINSDNCFAEWSRALGKSKSVIPLRMKPTDDSNPIEYNQLPLYIETLQYIDFVDDYDIGWKRLTHRLEQLEEEAFQTTQKNARQAYGILSQFAKGYWITDADDVPRLADTLIGRSALKSRINTILQEDKTVLLYGVGGVGKSALASELAADQLEGDDRPILWVEVGNAPIEQVFSAIGQAAQIQQEMARAQTDDDKIKLTRDLIRSRDVAWLVIDDAWNPAALTTLLGAIPKRNPIPVLITSRQRHIINGELHRVDNLHPDDARQLLTYHMANNTQHEGADDLCHTVSYHPFMLEIAGKLLKQRDISPQRLLEDMEATDLTTLSLPEGVAEAGRENMAKLLQQSLDALPDDLTRQVFLAFGAFPNPTATPEMLAWYLTDIDTLEKEKVAHLREKITDLSEWSDEEVIKAIWKENLLEPQDSELIEQALNTLFEHGLVHRIPSENRDGYPYSSEYYRVHDLAHTYSANQNPDLEHMVSACLAYTWRHNSPSHENFAALRPELDNLVGASTQAMTQERWEDTEEFAWNLSSPSGSKFLYYQGYYIESQTLFIQAAYAVRQRRAFGQSRTRILFPWRLPQSHQILSTSS